MSFPAVAVTRPSSAQVEATGGADAPRSGERIPALDALRGAARFALAAVRENAGPAFGFLRLTGTYSYGLCVIHAPVLYVIRDLGWSPDGVLDRLAYVLVAAAVSYGVAALSWHYFESPILGRGRPSRPSAAGLASADA